jgi:hypothetical protein
VHRLLGPERSGRRNRAARLTLLPFIDEHTQEVAAPPGKTWTALTRGAFGGSGAGTFARLLGCEETALTGAPGEVGSTVPGFRVRHAERPRKLELEGRHRFSNYELDFEIEDLGGGRSLLRAITHAEFPGLRGRIYRGLVIGSRGHVLATRRLLRAIARRAEAGNQTPGLRGWEP